MIVMFRWYGTHLLHERKMIKLVATLTLDATVVQPIEMSCKVYENKGNELPLIMLHGLFGSKRNWRQVAKTLSTLIPRKIYTIDARNHGESPHTDAHSSKLMAADIIKFMETHEISQCPMLGHSMGGRTMMHCALKYPNLVERLVVVDISPVNMPRKFSKVMTIFDALLSLNVPQELSIAEGRKFSEKILSEKINSQGAIDFILMNLRKRSSDGEFYWVCNLKVLRNSIKEFDGFYESHQEMQPYMGRTSFICGSRSEYVRPEDWPMITKLFPNAEIHWLDAGHLVHYDQPEEFINLVVKFLNV